MAGVGVPKSTQAQTLQVHGPAGFAGIVQKVKPAVVSVRVKLKNQVSSSDSTSGDSKDQDYLRRLMDRGATIGMDRFGLDMFLPTEERVATIAALVEQGYADRMNRQALMVGGPDAQSCLNLANTLRALGSKPQALERYSQAAEIDPEFSDAWNNLGTLLVELGRPDDACVAFGRALKADPEDAHLRPAGAVPGPGYQRAEGFAGYGGSGLGSQ